MAITDFLGGGLSAVPNFLLGGGLSGAAAPQLPDTLSGVLGLGPRTPGIYASVSTDPVTGLPTLAPQLPDYITSAQNKYADPTVQQFLQTLDPTTRNSLLTFDAQRISQGSPPLTREQMVQVGRAAVQQQVPKEGGDRHWWNLPGNAISDLKGIVGAIPRMFDPRTWVHELAAIPNMSSEISKAQEGGANFLQALGQAPGVRLVPGAFTLSNLTSPLELLKHPLYTALDLLPAAHEFAAATPVARAAEEARLLANTRSAGFTEMADAARALDPEDTLGRVRAAETNARISAREAQPQSPLKTMLLNKLDPETGQLVQSPAGNYLERLSKDTAVGKAVSTMFGFRPAWQEVARGEQRMIAVRDGRLPPKTIDEQLTRDSQVLGEYAFTEYGMDEVARRDLYRKQGLYNENTANLEFTPAELDIIGKEREILRRYAENSHGNLAQVAGINDEWFPKEIADNLNDVQEHAKVHERAVRFAEEARLPSGTLTADDFRNALAATAEVRDPLLRQREVRVIGNAMHAYGYDLGRGSVFSKELRTAIRNKSKTMAGPIQHLNAMLDAVDPATIARPMTATEIVKVLDRFWRYDRNGSLAGNRQAYALREAILAEDNVAMTKYLNNLDAQTTHAPPFMEDPAFREAVRSLRDRIHDQRRVGVKFDLKTADRYANSYRKQLASATPDRFDPLIREKALGRAREYALANDATPAQVQQFADHITNTNWQAADLMFNWQPGATQALWRDLTSDIGRTWQELKDEGYNPVFNHRVSRVRASNVISPRIEPVPNTEIQFRERINDFSPEIEDWAVSLTHLGVERLQRTAAENLIHFVVERYGVKQADLQGNFLPYVKPDGVLNVHQQMRDIVGHRYERFDPDARGVTWGGPAMDIYRQDQVFIPQGLAKALQKLNAPKPQILSTMDAATKLFRLSVVALSPRAQVYNILGGAVMVMGEGGPEIFKYMNDARRMRDNPELIMNPNVRADMGSANREFLDSNLGKAHAATSYLYGKSLRRMVDQSAESGFLARASDKISGVAEWSLKMNGHIDDMYRVMAYQYGYDKALTKGMSRAAAEVAGEELLRKTMMDWMAATPIERDIIKSIFPFYGFMRHAIRYVLRYPFDHPLRAAVVGAFGRAEMDDLGGLPMNLLAMVPMPFTEKSADGTQMHLSLGALNPFADVANMFTMAGWLSASNPVISTVLESVGVDSMGQAELYPNLHFDPETGRVAATHPNLLMSFAQNTIPQTQILFTALGMNQDFNDRARRDPSGAVRSLVSAIGLPPVPRPINLPQEFFKTELARQKSLSQVQTEALRSGDWSRARGYQSMHPLMAQVQQLASGDPQLLSPYLAKTQDEVMQLILAQSQLAMSPQVYASKSLTISNNQSGM